VLIPTAEEGRLGETRPRATTVKYLARRGARLPGLAPRPSPTPPGLSHCHDAAVARRRIRRSAALGGTAEGGSIASPRPFSMPAIGFPGGRRDGRKQQTTINHRRDRKRVAAAAAGGGCRKRCVNVRTTGGRRRRRRTAGRRTTMSGPGTAGDGEGLVPQICLYCTLHCTLVVILGSVQTKHL
jgi:hypothetical protein